MKLDGTAIFIIIIVVLVASLFFIPRWRMNRAARQVMNIFRQHNATSADRARTIDELGLRPRGFVEGMFRGRDYKPYALSALMKAEIILQTGDRFYLSEERLTATGLESRTKSRRF